MANENRVLQEVEVIDHSQNGIIVKGIYKILTENSNDIIASAEDVVEFDNEAYIVYTLLDAILRGIDTPEGRIILTEEEYDIDYRLNSLPVIALKPQTEQSKRACLILYKAIAGDIQMASRAASTNALRRAADKAKVKTIEVINGEVNIQETEKRMYTDKLRMELFKISRNLKIPDKELQEISIKLTGKKSSIEWTIDDINKIRSYIESQYSSK